MRRCGGAAVRRRGGAAVRRCGGGAARRRGGEARRAVSRCASISATISSLCVPPMKSPRKRP